MQKTTIGYAIRRERVRQGMDRIALARAAECSEANIRLMESQGSCPSVVLADRLLRVLKVKLTLGYVEGRKRLDLGPV